MKLVNFRNSLYGQSKIIRRRLYRVDLLGAISIASLVAISKSSNAIIDASTITICLSCFICFRVIFKKYLILLRPIIDKQLKSRKHKIKNSNSKYFKYMKTKNYDDYIKPWED